MQLAGNITLCGRSDLDPARFYSGYLANLGIYNNALSPTEMATLYANVRSNALQYAAQRNCTKPLPCIWSKETQTWCRGYDLRKTTCEMCEDAIASFYLVVNLLSE